MLDAYRSRLWPMSETRLMSSARYAGAWTGNDWCIGHATHCILRPSPDRKPVQCTGSISRAVVDESHEFWEKWTLEQEVIQLDIGDDKRNYMHYRIRVASVLLCAILGEIRSGVIWQTICEFLVQLVVSGKKLLVNVSHYCIISKKLPLVYELQSSHDPKLLNSPSAWI